MRRLLYSSRHTISIFNPDLGVDDLTSKHVHFNKQRVHDIYRCLQWNEVLRFYLYLSNYLYWHIHFLNISLSNSIRINAKRIFVSFTSFVTYNVHIKIYFGLEQGPNPDVRYCPLGHDGLFLFCFSLYYYLTQSIRTIAHLEINIVRIKLHNVLRLLKQDSALPCLVSSLLDRCKCNFVILKAKM